MLHRTRILLASLGLLLLAYMPNGFAGTETWFTPLTESAAVVAPNAVEELTSPWVAPTGLNYINLVNMRDVENDILSPGQDVVRVVIPSDTRQSMFDMLAFSPDGKYLFIPHEIPWGAGLSRYDIDNDENRVLFKGDRNGQHNNWANDWGAFDPARFTPNGTVIVAEEWTAEGRVIEVMNPLADPADIQVRELECIANVAHEGIKFSHKYKDTLYFIDEWNSGSVYKYVMPNPKDYTECGQTFVLSVDAFAGRPGDFWNEASNANQPRTGMATWVPVSDKTGHPLTAANPFMNGPTNDPRTHQNTRGGRPAADEVNGTPYGRPEDMEVAMIGNGSDAREIIYFTATSENTVYSVEMLGEDKARVGILVDSNTPTNLGLMPTTGTLSSPDNLAQDALGNIYIIEDKPNRDSVGGDIWFVRDTDNDGIAESIDHFLSNRVNGSESTGMIFNPAKPTEFVVAVQHPTSVALNLVPEGFGDAVWRFNLEEIDNKRFLQSLQWAHMVKKIKKRFCDYLY